jgi:hypothetical protein
MQAMWLKMQGAMGFVYVHTLQPADILGCTSEKQGSYTGS